MHTQRFASKPEAIAFMAQLQRDTQPLTKRKLTIEQWLEHWFANHGVAWERSTRMGRASLIELYVIPHLGKVQLQDLHRTEVREWRAMLHRKGASGNTINSANAVLSAALGAAVEDGLRESNPCIGLKPLPKRPVQRKPIPVAEVEAIRHQIIEPRDRLVVSLLAYAGLRPSEMVGLTWGQVRENTILVDRSVSVRGGAVKTTKTRATRSVPILGPVAEDLFAQKTIRKQAAISADPGIDEPVIANPSGTKITWGHWAARVWRPAVRHLGIAEGHPPYALRHTYVSLLISSGIDIVQVAHWAGHSIEMCMSTYAHLFAERQGMPGEDPEDTVMRVRHAISRAS